MSTLSSVSPSPKTDLSVFGLVPSDLSASSIVDRGTSDTRKTASALALAVARFFKPVPCFADQAELKSWAQGLRYDEIAEPIACFGEGIAYALARKSVGETSKNWSKGYADKIKAVFPVVGKASIRHDSSRKTDPTPSKGIDADTFCFRSHGGTYAAFGIGPKVKKDRSHVTDGSEDSSVSHEESVTASSAELAEHTADWAATYTHAATVAAAKVAADTATATANRESARVIDSLLRVIRNLGGQLTQADLEIATLKASAPSRPATARKSTATARK
jgi:hypothetical protein